MQHFWKKYCILEKSRKNLVKFGENSARFWQNLRNLKFWKKTAKNSAIFNENFEIRERRPAFWGFDSNAVQSSAKECIV